jgi:hypothetical protein
MDYKGRIMMRPNHIILFFIYIFSINTFSQSNSCSDVRLDAPGGPLEHSPIKHQDGMGLCDHYAACQMINAIKFYQYGKDSSANECSPIAVAGILTPRLNGLRLEQLSIQQILYHFDKVGSCDDDVVLKRFSGDGKTNFCQELKSTLNQLKPNKDNTGAYSPLPTEKKFYCGIKLTPDQAFDGVDLISRLLNTSANLAIIGNELEKVCQGHTQSVNIDKRSIVPVKGWEVPETERHSALKRAIDSMLDRPKKPLPPAIKYCRNVLFNRNISSIVDGKIDDSKCKYNGFSGDHVSVISGRRFNQKTQTCEYLVRNSAGTSCNEYDKDLECDKTKGGRSCPANTECGGQIWLPEKTLFDNTAVVVKAE